VTDADAKLISTKLENLEGSIERIEALIMKEITDLKNEQIADVRKTLEKYASDGSKAIDRVADDQRRLWEAVRSLENDRNRAHGGGKVVAGLITGIISIVSSSAAAVFITKLFK
jgi:t-SNARE complex subunit (syntaxin)